MSDILHRVGVNAKPLTVYKALTTIAGLRHWWTIDTKEITQKGGIINFGFCHMKVIESKPGRIVKWKCVQGPMEWNDTEVTFELKQKQGQTFILFKHAG